jgi:serine/threonine protein kinase
MASFEEQLKDSLSNAYDIERELGGGGMSRVFVATDRLLGRKVVIKVLSPELTAEMSRGRFRREIQVAAQLQHPHIVTLFTAGEHGDLVYYTMPFIEGESLKSALDKQGQLSVPDVVRVLYDVVDALAYAHRHGVIHRDIKPANILRSGSHALVTDFGVAKALNAAMPSSAMTSTGMAIGTPAYMAPEQLAGDPAADHRVDLYALGLLSYELLTGKSPFAGPTPQAVLAAVLTRDPEPLHEVRPEVPPKLSAIIMKCLSKIPGGRPPDAESLLDALDMVATASGEIRTREHMVPPRVRPPVTTPIFLADTSPTSPSAPAIPAVAVVSTTAAALATPALAPTLAIPATSPAPDAAPVYTPAPRYADEARKGRGKVFAGAAVLLLAAATGGVLWSQRASRSPAVNAPASIPDSVVSAASLTTAAASAPVAIDSVAMAAAVTKRLTDEAAKTGQPAINADSLRRVVQREIADSINRANAQRLAAAAAAAPAPAPATVTAVAPAPTVAPEPAPAAVTAPPPNTSGKKRLAITTPRDNSQPVLNSFTRAFIGALRASLDGSSAFDPIDQDSVRSAQASTASRDEAAKLLQPDVMIWPGYSGTGDTVNVVVTVWDRRSNSSYGIRVTTARVVPANADNYIGALVQSVMKQLDDLDRMPTIYRRR